jgi:hypothetical protein
MYCARASCSAARNDRFGSDLVGDEREMLGEDLSATARWIRSAWARARAIEEGGLELLEPGAEAPLAQLLRVRANAPARLFEGALRRCAGNRWFVADPQRHGGLAQAGESRWSCAARCSSVVASSCCTLRHAAHALFWRASTRKTVLVATPVVREVPVFDRAERERQPVASPKARS